MTALRPCNHVFIDFENVHELDLSLIGADGFHFVLLVGAKQTRLSTEVVEKLLASADSVQLVRLESSGSNALDFALAYYVGRTAATHPGNFFHIISKDTGYDPLVQHLRNRKILITRHPCFTSLRETVWGVSPLAATLPKLARTLPAPAKSVVAQKAAVKSAVKQAPAGEMDRVLGHLKKNGNPPRREKTLTTHLAAFLKKDPASTEIGQLIRRLVSLGYIDLNDKKAVVYKLP